MLGGKSRAGCDSHTAADNGICSEVAGRGIGDVHRSALAAAIACFLAQQLGEHPIRSGPLSQAVAVSAMCAGDVVVPAQRFADAYRDRFLAAVEMRQARHQCPRVKFVHLLFKHADAHHLTTGVQPLLLSRGKFRAGFRLGHRRRHFFAPYFFTPALIGVLTPDIAARTSNMQAKSNLVKPMPRAAVRISLLAAVVGKGTSTLRPRSIARTMSFCIMFTSNHASSGCCNTNGPRY